MKEAKEKEEREVNKPRLLFSLGPRTKHQNYLEKVLKFMEDESFKCDEVFYLKVEFSYNKSAKAYNTFLTYQQVEEWRFNRTCLKTVIGRIVVCSL